MSTPPPYASEVFPLRKTLIILLLGFAPAIILIAWYLSYRVEHARTMEARLTPAGVRLLGSAPSVTAFHLFGANEPSSTATATLLGYHIDQKSPEQDAYFVMRLRKAMLASGNTLDSRAPCNGSPQLAFNLSDGQTSVTLLISLVCHNLGVVQTDVSGKVVAEGRASLSALGAQQISFLEAEAFQPR